MPSSSSDWPSSRISSGVHSADPSLHGPVHSCAQSWKKIGKRTESGNKENPSKQKTTTGPHLHAPRVETLNEPHGPLVEAHRAARDDAVGVPHQQAAAVVVLAAALDAAAHQKRLGDVILELAPELVALRHFRRQRIGLAALARQIAHCLAKVARAEVLVAAVQLGKGLFHQRDPVLVVVLAVPEDHRSRLLHGHVVVHCHHAPGRVDEEANLKHADFGMRRDKEGVQQVILPRRAHGQRAQKPAVPDLERISEHN